MDAQWAYYLWAALLVAGCGVAWLLNMVMLPGNWMIAGGAALFVWLMPVEVDRGMSWKTVALLLGLAIVGEVVEFVSGAAGAAKRGASKRGVLLSMVGAIVGGVLGLMAGSPVPVLGSFVMAVLGGALGAFAGAYLGEAWKGRSEAERVASGRGAFAGRLWGTLGKLVIGAVMLAIVVGDAFF
jgi:uncharacterized protein YqgC (DUF456 family)